MINPFPTVFLALIAYAILRVFIGAALLTLGLKHFRHSRPELTRIIATRFPFLSRLAGLIAWKYGVAEILIGLMFIAGFFTQIAAIIAAILSIKMLVFRKTFTYPLVPTPVFWFLTLGISISLFITGAGIFAFDIPI